MATGQEQGYPHEFNADETRQAQQGNMNDVPLDVNMNAVVVRSQCLTVDVLGKGFVAAQERRQIIADRLISKDSA